MTIAVVFTSGVGHGGVGVKAVPIGFFEEENSEFAYNPWVFDSGVHVLVRHEELFPMRVE